MGFIPFVQNLNEALFFDASWARPQAALSGCPMQLPCMLAHARNAIARALLVRSSGMLCVPRRPGRGKLYLLWSGTRVMSNTRTHVRS